MIKRALFGSKQQISVPAPIIDLINYRSKMVINRESISKTEIQLINEIPALEKNDLAKINKLKTAAEVLRHSVPKYKYDRAILTSLSTSAKPPISDVFPVVICYQVFFWLYSQKTKIEDVDIILFVNCFQKIGRTHLQSVINFQFYEILNAISGELDFQWSANSIIPFLQYFESNLTLEPCAYSNFITILKFALNQGNDELIEEALTLVDNLIVQNAPMVNVSDHGNLIILIQPHIQSLKPIALHILALLANKKGENVARNLSDAFMIIASSFIQSISSSDLYQVLEIPSEQDNDPVIPDVTAVSQTNLQFLAPFDFIPYFKEPPFDLYNSKAPVSQLMTQTTRDICKSMKVCLNTASFEYKKVFTETFLHHLSAISLSKAPAFTEITSAFLMLLEGFENKKIFDDITLPLLVKSNIFHQSIHVFRDVPLNGCINTYREKILELIYQFCPNNLNNFLKQFESRPYVYVEHLTRILNHPNWFPLKSLGNNQFYISLMNLSRQFQCLNMESQASVIINARNSLYIFMSNLLIDQTVAPSYISSQSFSLGYLWLIFEPSISYNVLLNVRNSIANMKYETVSKETFDHFLNFMTTSINSCRQSGRNDPQYQILARNISQELLTALQHNCLFSPYFEPLLHPFSEYLQEFPDESILSDVLSFLILYATSKGDFALSGSLLVKIYNSIKKVNGNDPSLKTECMLFNLLRGSYCSPADTTSFLISSPSILPLIIASFGSSSRAVHIIKLIYNLCVYSDFNRVMCHDGDVDLILLSYVCSCQETSVIAYHGCEFTLRFSKEDVQTLIIPLISMISLAKSNNADVNVLVEHLVNEPDVELCGFINQLVSKYQSIPSPLFALGSNQKEFTVEGVYHSDVETGFTVSFLLYVDKEILKESNSNVTLLSFTDVNENLFSFYLNQTTLYAKHEGDDTRTTVNLIKNITGSKWMNVTFCVSFTNEKVMLFNYQDNKKLNDSELSPFFFSPGEIKISVGGTDNSDDNPISEKWKNIQMATVGGIRIFKGVLSRDEVIELHNTPENLISRAIVCSDKISLPSHRYTYSFPRDEVIFNGYFAQKVTEIQIHVNDTRPAPLSIVDVLVKRNDCNTLAKFFNKIDESPDVYPLMILGLMGQLFKRDQSTQQYFNQTNTILGALFEHTNSLNSKLYFSFYDVLRQIKVSDLQKIWFDSFILNTWLWSKCDYSEFVIIIYHYSHILIPQYHNVFKKDSYFSTLLNQTMLLFALGEDGKPETQITEVPLLNSTYSEKAILHCQELFLVSLARIASMNLNEMDVASLFAHVSNWKTKSTLIKLLKLVFDITASLVKVKEYQNASIPSIHSLLNIEDIDIIEHTLVILPELSKTDKMNHLIFAAIRFNSLSARKQVFDRMVGRLSNSPNLFVLLCIVALSLKGDAIVKLSDALEKLVSQNVSPEFETQTWFIFPLLLAFHSEKPEMMKLCKFISHILITTSDIQKFTDECNHIFAFITLICSVTDFWNSDLPLILLDFLQNIKNKFKAGIIATNILDITLFKTWTNSFHKMLLDEFEKSDFVKYRIPIDIEEHKAKYESTDNLSFIFNKLKNENVRTINVAFEIVLDDKNKVTPKTHKMLSEALNLMAKARSFPEDEIALITYFTENLPNSEKITSSASSSTLSMISASSSLPFLDKKQTHKAMFNAEEIIERHRSQYREKLRKYLSSGIESLQQIDEFAHRHQMTESQQLSFIAESQMKAEYRCHLDSIPKQSSSKNSKEEIHFDQTSCYGFCPFKIKSDIPHRKHVIPIDPLDANEILFEHQAQLLSFNRQQPTVVTFMMNRKYMFIYSISKNRHFKLSSIEYVFPRCTGTGAEFFLTSGKSFLINFGDDFSLFVKAMTHIQLPNCRIFLKSEFINQQNLMQQWLVGSISNFDYINKLNVLAGRSYKDRQHYPVFPSLLEDFDTFDSVKKSFEYLRGTAVDFNMGVKDSSNNFDVIRADYFYRLESIDELPKWAESKIDYVTKMRKILESKEITSIIHRWINIVFNTSSTGFAHFQLFKADHPNRKSIRGFKGLPGQVELTNMPIQDIVSAVSITEDALLVLSRNGVAGVLSVSTAPTVQIVMTQSYTIEGSFHFGAQNIFGLSRGLSRGRIGWYSKEDHLTRLVGESCLLNTITTFPEVELIACCEDDIYFCSDACTVSIASPGMNPYAICCTTSRISKIVADGTFHILIVCTIDSHLYIFSAPNGRMVKKISIGKDEILNVAITPKWGFIVIQTEKFVSVFNVNGVLIRKFAFAERVLNWFAYANNRSFDFVVFENTDHRVGFFDPLLENSVKFFYETREVIPLITYDSKTNYFLFLSENKNINFIPHP